MSEVTTWRAELANEMRQQDDSGPVIAWAPSEATFDERFVCDYGGSEGKPVLAWTQSRVYFPVVYDGAEWMGSAPRNPQADGQNHVGGQ